MRHQYNRPYQYNRPRPYRSRRRGHLRIGRLILLILILAAIIAGIVIGIMFLTKTGLFHKTTAGNGTDMPSASIQEQTVALPSADPNLVVQATAQAQPASNGLQSQILQNGAVLASYTREHAILFSGEYATLNGVTTQGSGNLRNHANWGAFSSNAQSLDTLWNNAFASNGGFSSQPLIIRWDADIRLMMNLNDSAKQKDSLTEIIYPSANGTIYFTDIDSGEATRDPIKTQIPFCGTPTLDPRGYPLLYAIQGSSDAAYLSIYNLIDGELLYQNALSSLPTQSACSPLLAANADTLIWNDSNKIFTTRLNSNFDRAAGSISISPDLPVEYSYTVNQSSENRISSGIAAWKNYLYFADGSGLLQCVDLNTMTPVFAQNLDGSIAAPILIEEAADSVSIYTATSQGGVADGNATASVKKTNALTGEILWESTYTCAYRANESGGALSAPKLGSGSLAGMLYITLDGTADSPEKSQLLALDTTTGKPIFTYETAQSAKTSPALAYSSNNAGYVIQYDTSGAAVLLDGKTGNVLKKVSSGLSAPSSPAGFGSLVISGDSAGKIACLEIK
ncbi:MAG: PQQ-binding-like beta-propeller repeat protein [Christensenella sp.]|nr:PQQ-binding-like beta-propeller repeat protein [Christensenella sp.]